uniref:Uncharacterized protein n=1 Tax=Agrobacterium tumefaciens TaxID=358 RepID=A0A3Q8AYP3_AGRTU|nr:hypothetical protein AgrTiEU6_211 [Agrobacterium tumefaciens]
MRFLFRRNPASERNIQFVERVGTRARDDRYAFSIRGWITPCPVNLQDKQL